MKASWGTQPIGWAYALQDRIAEEDEARREAELERLERADARAMERAR